MNKKYLLRYFTGLLFLVIVSSCTNDSGTTPTPAAGILSGGVQLWDDKTSQLSDNSGVTITVDDLSGTSTTTDASGKYAFATLPYGLHDMTISKTGYGTHRLFGVLHASSTNGTVLPAIQLGKQSTTSVTSLSVSGAAYNGTPGVSVMYSVAPTPTSSNRGYVRYFLSTDKTVSNTNYMYASSVASVLNNNVTGGFTKEDLLLAGFTTGQTVYVRLYGESVQSNTYIDPNAGIRMFPNINPNTVAAVAFVMP